MERGTERKREHPPGSSSGLPAKKPKVESSSRSGDNSPSAAAADSWELVAIDCEASELVSSVSRAMDKEDTSTARALICGAIKLIRNQRAKPDKVLYLGLMYLATMMPYLFNSEHVVQALCSLLRRDPTQSFKSKGNATVPVLAANLLYKGFQEHKHWPEIFIKSLILFITLTHQVYTEDSIGERVWVDMEETKGFVDNIVTGFNTKPANRALLPADFLAGPGGRSDSPTVSSAANTDDEAEGEGQSGTSGGTKVKLETAPVMPRYRDNLEGVETVVMELVREQLSRRQAPETVGRNLLRFLSTACGLTEVRAAAAPKLELWLQNPKLMRATQELLLSMCANCASHTARDIEVIGQLAKMRFKTKAVTNLYLSGMKELIAAHQENLGLVVKLTIYNELSNARNPNNMALLQVIALLRELVRQLRHDLPLGALCRNLLKERRDQAFRDFTPKERMMAALADLVSLCILLAVSPAVREAAGLLSRGDKREIQTLNNFRFLVAKIQRDAVWWLHDTVPRMFHPTAADFNHAMHKQYHKDNWPSETDRATMFRLASEAPVLQNTLVRLTLMGMSKEHPISCPDLLDLMDRIVKRAAMIQNEGAGTLIVEKTDLFELIFGLCTYRHPENITLPQGYFPPTLAISSSYWKAWIILLILAAHNPSTFGNVAWEKYPTLRALMEMCITNHFIFPPPTMALLEEENKEMQLAAIEKQQILEFESHLAAASTKVTINENNSLLLSQLTSLDPTGAARRPPQTTLTLLKTLNDQLHLGHRLCRSRRPDFLLDVIQRQGASQAMPWLADLVESSEGALRQVKQQQLLTHLRGLLIDTSGPDAPTQCCEVLEYFLRRLGSTQAPSRALAIKGLKLLLTPGEDEEEDTSGGSPHAWLLQQLPSLPHFALARPQAVLALRQACQAENELSAMRAYLQFLAQHSVSDPLPELTDLVLDMAQLIVERNTITQALLPSPENDSKDPPSLMSLHSLMQIFMAYLQKAREPRKEAYTWSESQDQILVTWSSGEESTMHILVVHAMIILLTYGPGQDPELFSNLMETWVPANKEPPKAFLVDTSEEALLIPDWLKLRMIQSSAPGLVDAALTDLDHQQLLLFVQSFGIQPTNMSKLLQALDAAVDLDTDGVREAVQDKTYMVQLVQVQHYRGATGGHKFLQLLREPSPPPVVIPTPSAAVPPVRLPLPSAPPTPSLNVSMDEVPWLLASIFVTMNEKSPVTELAKSYISRCIGVKSTPVVRDDFDVLREGKIEKALKLRPTKELVDMATQRLLDQSSNESSTGLLLDWLSCLEPEMIGSCPDKQMQLLFAKAKGSAASCRPYLLTLLTHRSSWATLHACMTALLKECNRSYDPGAVLDFLWALIGNPKLWQGREKRTPKHHSVEDIMSLSTQQVCVLLDYVVEEAQGHTGQADASSGSVPLLSTSRQREVLEGRVPLLLQCVRPEDLYRLARHLAPNMMAREGSRSRVSRLLLLQLYLSVPALAQHLSEVEREAMLAGASVSSRGGCSLDVTSHCLLSALAAGKGKDWPRKAMEFELAARKMAATHPVLVLRWFHGHLKDVLTSLARTVTLLQSFVSHDAQRALKYLQRHCQLLHHLQASHPGLGLQTLLAGLSLPARDGDEPELLVAAAIGPPSEVQAQSAAWAQQQVALVLSRLNRHTQGEDVQGALQDLDHVSQRRPGVLEACTDMLSSLLLSPAGGVRSLAHLLLLRLLRHAPASAGACVPAYLRFCLETSRSRVRDATPEFDDEVIREAELFQVRAVYRLCEVHAVRLALGALPDLTR
ncbi:hypothetical protein B566_EDAN002852 [Ephemera danica]|nr:hypothetical protein B566_EDAN002852 [Ephemera danica]